MMKESIKQELNEILKKYKYKSVKNINWDYISKYYKLSENFVREFKDKVSWDYISQYQELSEDFIREFKDKVYWYCISEDQKLSVEFISEFREKLNIKKLINRNLITQEDINKIFRSVSRFDLMDI